jgi:hypothetical protein
MTKMSLAENDDVITAISAHGSDHRAIDPISGDRVYPWL